MNKLLNLATLYIYSIDNISALFLDRIYRPRISEHTNNIEQVPYNNDMEQMSHNSEIGKGGKINKKKN